jgi:hypothetical protein
MLEDSKIMTFAFFAWNFARPTYYPPSRVSVLDTWPNCVGVQTSMERASPGGMRDGVRGLPNRRTEDSGGASGWVYVTGIVE